MEKATLAGGCFWCIESAFLNEIGLLSTCSGYTGGEIENPTYEQVCTGKTGHFEAVELLFDPQKITYLQILDIFWRHIDPLDRGGQFADRGNQYKTAIFYHDEIQRALAEDSKKEIESLFGAPIATLILSAKPFYPAERYHQRYCITQKGAFDRYQSSHLPYLKKLWEGKREKKQALEKRLTPLQYQVTQKEGTEPPFDNPFWNKKEEGLYVDILSGEPLFISCDKYDSGCGWPAFTRPIDSKAIKTREDFKLGVLRQEVRSASSDAHLGHVFDDGPPPHGLRYCINSASLRFIPKEKLIEAGYEEYLPLFI